MNKNNFKNDIRMLPLAKIELNEGQLPGLPANPRQIKQDKFDKLKKNIADYPEMLEWRSLLVYPLDSGNYIIIGGNMRYRAMKELGHTEAPAVIIPKETPVEKLQAYTILDNNGFGQWDWDALANEWPEELLGDWGLDVFDRPTEMDIDSFFDENSGEEKGKNEHLTVVIPEDMTDRKAEIKSEIEAILADYSGVKIK